MVDVELQMVLYYLDSQAIDDVNENRGYCCAAALVNELKLNRKNGTAYIHDIWR